MSLGESLKEFKSLGFKKKNSNRNSCWRYTGCTDPSNVMLFYLLCKRCVIYFTSHQTLHYFNYFSQKENDAYGERNMNMPTIPGGLKLH